MNEPRLSPRLHRRSRLSLGLLATGALLTLWLEARPLQPTEAPPTLHQGSAEAPPRLSEFRPATEYEEHVCQENTIRGDGPAHDDCSLVPTGPIYEDDPWGRWNCATMGNRVCGPPRWLTRGLTIQLAG